jgi:hypothetical protein
VTTDPSIGTRNHRIGGVGQAEETTGRVPTSGCQKRNSLFRGLHVYSSVSVLSRGDPVSDRWGAFGSSLLTPVLDCKR